MRPIWKGHISFGLVNVPVTLYSAEQRTDVQFHMIDSRDFSRVRYQRVNADSGEEVPWDQIVKGYEFEEGNYVVVGEDELKAAAPEATQTVDIEAFVDLAAIDFMYFDKPYFLEPGKRGEKGYALLRETLKETGKAGIARLVIRTRQYIAAMVPRDDALVLNLLRFHQELRSTDDLELPGSAAKIGITKQEIKMAQTLVESMSQEWDPASYKDEYRTALMKWIEKKIKAGNVEQKPESIADDDEPPASFNIMDALKKSIAKSGGASKSKATPVTKKKVKKKAG